MAAPGGTVHSTRTGARSRGLPMLRNVFCFSVRVYMPSCRCRTLELLSGRYLAGGRQLLQATACASNSMRAVESRVIARPSFNPVSARKPSCSAA
jgi:hypothetical protein